MTRKTWTSFLNTLNAMTKVSMAFVILGSFYIFIRMIATIVATF